jgi:hypothetical protein
MPDTAASTDQQRVAELRVTGQLMTLDAGLFCILHKAQPADQHGLPGVRISLAPGPSANGVAISGFREDGWLASSGDAALVRVTQGPAQILVTVYQSPGSTVPAPSLQVLRLTEDEPLAAAPQLARPQAALPAPAPPAQTPPVQTPPVQTPPVQAPPAEPVATAAEPREIAAHVQQRGDIVGAIGAWVGDRGSARWIEGFGIAPLAGIPAEEIEYQAVLGRGWLSPWAEGGQFCGSRGMALPILGLCVRLRGAAAQAFELRLTASFVDGTTIGPVGSGEPCEAASLAPLEAFLLELHRRPAQARPAAVQVARAASAKPSKPVTRAPVKAAARPAAKAPAKTAPKAKAAPAGRAKAAPPKRRR